VDVVLLVRGGGSLEDLQPFNTELLARAIAATRTPVVSGVGPEVDVSIADLAADARAATPSAAAALALPDRETVGVRLERDTRRLVGAAGRRLERLAAELEALGDALRMQAPRARLELQRGRLRAAGHSLGRGVGARLERARADLGRAAGRLESLSPLAVLGRGYAIVRRAPDGAIVRRAADVAPGDGLEVRLGEGEIEAEVRRRRG
jgi:exodeoxyribonuclease VII large subunit